MRRPWAARPQAACRPQRLPTAGPRRADRDILAGMARRTELPRVLTPAVARSLGVTRSRMRTELEHGTWRSMARGVVLTRADLPTRTDWADAGLWVAGETAALSGWDALRARGIGDRRPPAAPVLVLTREGRSRRIGGVHIRRTDRPYAAELTSAFAEVLALSPIVGVPRAVADAAFWERRRAGVRALVAAAVQQGGCPVEDLVAELEAGPRQYSGWLRRAIAEIGAGARSAAEAEAVRRLSRGAVPVFELNVPIIDQRGVHIYTVDVLWRALRAALEIDSREYHFSDAEWQGTLARHNALTRAGLSVTHYPPSDMSDPREAWLHETAEWLRVRSRELAVPWTPSRLRVAPAGAAPPPYRVTLRNFRAFLAA